MKTKKVSKRTKVKIRKEGLLYAMNRTINGREKINTNKQLNVQMEGYTFAQIPKKSVNHQKHLLSIFQNRLAKDVFLEGLLLIFCFE